MTYLQGERSYRHADAVHLLNIGRVLVLNDPRRRGDEWEEEDEEEEEEEEKEEEKEEIQRRSSAYSQQLPCQAEELHDALVLPQVLVPLE